MGRGQDRDARRREQDARRRERAREEVSGELREAVGPRAAERAERHGALDAAIDGDHPHTVSAAFARARPLIALAFFVALTAGAAIAIVSGIWWFVLVALVLHAVGTAVVVVTTVSLTAKVEGPDPRTAAALKEHGVRDPDAALNEAVRAASELSHDERADRAREQQQAITPAHESRPVDTPPRGRGEEER